MFAFFSISSLACSPMRSSSLWLISMTWLLLVCVVLTQPPKPKITTKSKIIFKQFIFYPKLFIIARFCHSSQNSPTPPFFFFGKVSNKHKKAQYASKFIFNQSLTRLKTPLAAELPCLLPSCAFCLLFAFQAVCAFL